MDMQGGKKGKKYPGKKKQVKVQGRKQEKTTRYKSKQTGTKTWKEMGRKEKKKETAWFPVVVFAMHIEIEGLLLLNGIPHTTNPN